LHFIFQIHERKKGTRLIISSTGKWFARDLQIFSDIHTLSATDRRYLNGRAVNRRPQHVPKIAGSGKARIKVR
jgi:hypothetical protein